MGGTGIPLSKIQRISPFLWFDYQAQEAETQEEVDEYWTKLSEGGQEGACGWLKDRFGLSWQVVPTVLMEMLQDPAKSDSLMQAIMRMKKLDVEGLEEAYSAI